MPHLTFNLTAGGAGHVHIKQDGELHELKTVTGINIATDGMATVTLIALKTDGHVEISDKTADAILRADAQRELAFLTEVDHDDLRIWRAKVGQLIQERSQDLRTDSARAIEIIDKILAELDRRNYLR
jgi:hypothetical protein